MRIDEVGFYLTNEVFLYRFLGFVEGGEDDVIELEDCYALDVVRASFTTCASVGCASSRRHRPDERIALTAMLSRPGSSGTNRQPAKKNACQPDAMTELEDAW